MVRGHRGNFVFLSCQRVVRRWSNLETREHGADFWAGFLLFCFEGRRPRYFVPDVVERGLTDRSTRAELYGDEYFEKRLSSFGSTQHVCNCEESGRLFVETSLMVSMRNVATLLLITTHSSLGPRKLTIKRLASFPDENIITVGAARFHCAEVLYQTSFTGNEACGFHDTSFVSFMKCDADVRKNCAPLSQCRVNRCPCRS